MDNSATDSTASKHYTVLARRFRPQTFSEVIGQQHVAQSLQNAIRSGRVAHAYLFTGARGVGKTSMARILAKALNCPDAVEGVPCNHCEICDGIAAGNEVDVQEIDGASNRGIDDIRSLRANVNVKSMRAGNKVYIIDEVHMLTKEAFNALLKTLEEPPPNVKFVFCTTEPNKVPDTILSRCQRFDFSTIETQNIVMRLQQIADIEGYTVAPEALALVARRATGSMRDSQSIFDQLLAFGETNISADDVHRMLGTAADDRLVALIDALLQRRRDLALSELEATLNNGVELGELVVQLLNYFRDLMILASAANDVPLLGVSDHFRTDLERQAAAWGLQAIVAGLEILIETQSRMFRSSYGRALVELAIVRISLLADLERINTLIEGLQDGSISIPEPAIPAATAPPTKEVPAEKSTPENPAPENPISETPISEESVPEKKTELSTETAPQTPQIENSSHSDEQSLESEQPEQHPVIEFQTGNESQILTQLIAQADDTTKSHLQKVSSLAIIAPNQLDLLFPVGYDFYVKYCDRPEIRSRLETVLAKIVGRSIRLVVRSDNNQTEKTVSTQSNGEATSPTVDLNRRTLMKTVEQDSFIAKALDVFDGTLRDARELPNPGNAE